MVIPGLGQGVQGLKVRSASILVLAFTSVMTGTYASMPDNFAIMVSSLAMEYLLGFALGVIPAIIVAGVQTAGQLSSTTMGLGAAQLIDPTLGVNVSSVSRILGDMVILLFLLIGGHRIILSTMAGLGGEIVPGTFLVTGTTIKLLISQTGNIFKVGVMVSAPVIVALLLTQFVMGLISKAVPQVNIFIVSFPLTIGIGLVLTLLSLPDMLYLVFEQLKTIDSSLLTIVSDTVLKSQ